MKLTKKMKRPRRREMKMKNLRRGSKREEAKAQVRIEINHMESWVALGILCCLHLCTCFLRCIS